MICLSDMVVGNYIDNGLNFFGVDGGDTVLSSLRALKEK